MGLGKSCISPPDTEPKNTAETDARYNASAPVRMMRHDDTRDACFPTGSSFQVSQKTDGEVKRPEQSFRRMPVPPNVSQKTDGEVKRPEQSFRRMPVPPKNKNGSRDLDERSNDISRPGNEVPITYSVIKVRTEDLSGSENKHALDLTNQDQTMKSKRKEKTYRDAGEGNENHGSSSSNDMNRDHEYEQNVKRLESRLSQLRAEKDGLLNRLSEIGAIRLTENNPNVTDLGDPNRPEKVVEELSEIYDNEWTDAYEHLTKIRKKNTDLCAKKLLQILQEVFTICMSSTKKKRKALRKAITKYVGLTKEDQDEIDLKDIEKRIREYRRKKMQNNFKSLEEEVGHQLKKILKKETFDDLSEYIRSCVRICWKLYTREPPMHLDFGDSQQPAQSSNNTANKMHFDKAKFMSYTKSGDYIDYVVWPAVYLYKDGPLMKKGVAQGIQEDKEYKDGPAKSA